MGMKSSMGMRNSVSQHEEPPPFHRECGVISINVIEKTMLMGKGRVGSMGCFFPMRLNYGVVELMRFA